MKRLKRDISAPQILHIAIFEEALDGRNPTIVFVKKNFQQEAKCSWRAILFTKQLFPSQSFN